MVRLVLLQPVANPFCEVPQRPYQAWSNYTARASLRALGISGLSRLFINLEHPLTLLFFHYTQFQDAY